MAVNLKRDAKDVDIEDGEYQRLLKNLQANILRPHGRNNVRHVFIAFTAGQPAARGWLKASAPKITTARQQYDQLAAREASPGLDGGTVFNLYLSAAGYRALGLDPDEFGSTFEGGMKNRGKDPDPATWEAPFQQEIHAMVAVADTSFTKAKEGAQAVAASLAGVGDVLLIQEGTTLRRPTTPGETEPVEHFGYFDGISNPIFTARDLEAEKRTMEIGDKWDPTAKLVRVLRDDPFTDEEDAFGSFLVYRKLHQDVGLFEQRVTALAAQIGQSEDLAGAYAVGRFRDGTPVEKRKTPQGDFSVTNNFNYFRDGANYRCPAHAHIRKVNPRERVPLRDILGEGRKRRITRRGIPYGKPVPGLVEESIPSDANRSADRGLLFLCFQANIKTQFEFIQKDWVDNARFPDGLIGKDTGYDPLIGQDTNSGQHWPNEWDNKDAGRTQASFESAVTLKGGEYFFAPSIAFLQALSG